MNNEFEKGEVVEHKLSREWVMILNYDASKKVYNCRTKAFEEVRFFDFELQERKK